MNILHLEASPGWGGQELRILREAEGMRARGHKVFFVVQHGGGLVDAARKSGFLVYELSFRKKTAPFILFQIIRLIKRHHIEIVNTHSSLDAWIGGLAGRLCGSCVIRTRHLSTPIRKGINSRILYNWLADYVVTTCEEAAVIVRNQAHLSQSRCFSVPTGVNPDHICFQEQEVACFRKNIGVGPEDCLVGTLCVLRGWKGISDFLLAAKKLESVSHVKWVVVGSGVSEEFFKNERKALGLEERVIFTGHITPPFIPLAAMDIFLLLSRANEGVSQASLQAAWLEKPLITTTIGGLPEVCIEGVTGFQVPIYDPEAVAAAVMRLVNDPNLRKNMGKKAKELVLHTFTLDHTLDQMEKIYKLNDLKKRNL